MGCMGMGHEIPKGPSSFPADMDDAFKMLRLGIAFLIV